MSSDNVHHDQSGEGQKQLVVLAESSKLLPWLMLCMLISGVAIALAIGAQIRATDATTAATNMQSYVDELTLEMARRGINVPKN